MPGVTQAKYRGNLFGAGWPYQHTGSNGTNVFVIDATGETLAREDTVFTDERP